MSPKLKFPSLTPKRTYMHVENTGTEELHCDNPSQHTREKYYQQRALH